MMKLLDAILRPASLPYDIEEWEKMPFMQQAKLSCQAWYAQGFGTPISIVAFYILKMALWIWIFFIFAGYSTELGTFENFSEWWFTTEAFGKAILWTSLLEVIGFAGASGPLTAKFIPPLGGSTYYLRPGTIRIPLFPKAPLIGGDKRNIFTVLIYIALLVAYFRACMAPAVTPEYIWPILGLLLLNGLFDRTVYLTARGDIYFPMMACYLFPSETLPALKICLVGIWFWAAFSKLTPVFVNVVQVMICNSPVLRHFGFLRRALYKDAPNDLRPSGFANVFAHMGTAVEFILPIMLLMTTILSPEYVIYAAIGISLFHLFIFINIPMAVPLEWNVIMVYGAWALYMMFPEVSPLELSNPYIIGLFVLLYLILPIIGNFWPKYITFLMSMRYYAGTWAYSIWLFKDDAKDKVDQHVVKTSKSIESQLMLLYRDMKIVKGITSRLMGFRLLHLPTGAARDLYHKATEGKDGYYWVEGEFFAGEVIGWNFGDGHLHHEPVLESLQNRCQWESGEVRVIMVESPQLHNGKMHWRIHDAKDGLIEEGYTYLKDLKNKQPWAISEQNFVPAN